jgi:cob(I)alamin adenosyltransferase
VSSYGAVDELNACLGAARAHGLHDDVDAVLARVQVDLFTLGAELATVPGKERNIGIALLDDADVARLEGAIDASEASLEPLKSFVLPGGTVAAANLHVARTVCRRAEREVVALAATEPTRELLTVYLNRLSDLLFSLARRANQLAGVADVPWTPR